MRTGAAVADFARARQQSECERNKEVRRVMTRLNSETNFRRRLARASSAVDCFTLDHVGHVDAIRHRPAHVVFHQLGVDAGFLEFLGVGIFF